MEEVLEIRIIAEQTEHKHIAKLDEMRRGDAQIIYWEMPNKESKRCLLLSCYNCGCLAYTIDHKHDWFQDGTVTVEPSLICQRCDTHYYIEANKIRKV